MNYRHAFHAGNHCDVLKHTALALILAALKRKDKPFAVLDAFAGRGRYDLASEEARRSPEFEGGVARLFGPDAAADAPPQSLRPYLDAIAAENPSGRLRWYPGSPTLIADALRPRDRLVACELHPGEAEALSLSLDGIGNARVEVRDGYEAVRAHLPFAERRGLTLIDPPFERPGEFVRIARAVSDAKKRFATGVVMVWSPIKDASGRRRFDDAMADLNLPATLQATLSLLPPAMDRLTGSAVFVVNPPFGLADGLAEALPFLSRTLAAPGGGWTLVARERDAIVLDAAGGA